MNILREVDTTDGGLTALEGVSNAATWFSRDGLNALIIARETSFWWEESRPGNDERNQSARPLPYLKA